MVRKFLSVIAVGALATAGASQALAQTVKIDGSSTVQPVTSAIAEAFEAKIGKIKVEVGTSGTGGGFKKFVRGEIDIANASRPIQAEEMNKAKEAGIEYIELPIAFDALTVVVNPSNTFLKELTVEDLKKMWAPEAKGTISKWSDVRAEWPAEPITLFGAGTDSGTFDYFTEAVCGKKGASRSDYTMSEDDNVLVQGISRDAHSLGYFGYSYYLHNKDKLRAVPIVNPKTKKAVEPSNESVAHGEYVPLGRPVFIYVNKKSLERPEVRRFVEYYVGEGHSKIAEEGFVPLTEQSYAAALERVKKRSTGTAFGGHSAVGLHVDELFSRPLSSEPVAKDAKPDSKTEVKPEAQPAKEPK